MSTVSVSATRKKLSNPPSTFVAAIRAAFDIPEFCEAHRISRALFYILIRDGRGPVVMKVGRRTLISIESAEVWRRQMEAGDGVAQ